MLEKKPKILLIRDAPISKLVDVLIIDIIQFCGFRESIGNCETFPVKY